MPSASDEAETFCRSMRKLFVIQSTAVITGSMFMDAVLASVAGILLGQTFVDTSSIGLAVKDAAQYPWWNLFLQMQVYVAILLIMSYLSYFMHTSTKTPNRVTAAYASGIKLVPAWAWKNFVDSIADILTALNVLDMDLPAQAGLFALVLIVSTAALQLSLEALPLTDKPFLKTVVDTQRTSMALAAGYVLHLFADTFTSTSTTGEFLFAAILSVAVPAVEGQLQHLDTKPGIANGMKTLLVSSLTFVLAYAWNDALDAVFATWMSQGVPGQLLVSIMMTMLAVLVVFLSHTAWATEFGVTELFVLVASMNVGWSWMDFASACLGDQTVSLLAFWMYTTVVIATWIGIAFIMEVTIGTFERQSAEGLPMQAVLERKYGSA